MKTPLYKKGCGPQGLGSPIKFKGANSSNSDCWKGYEKKGTKPSPSKPGVTVNNCVKK